MRSIPRLPDPNHLTTKQSASVLFRAFIACAWLCVLTWSLSAQSGRAVRVGEPCAICSEAMGAEDLVLTHRGASVPVHAGHCQEVWESDPNGHEGKLPQPRSALFQEEAGSKLAAPRTWFWIGIYGASSVLCAAACAFIAVRRRQAPGAWLLIGLVGNVAGFAISFILIPKGSDPLGLAQSSSVFSKLPQTRAPRPCPECSEPVHPSATRCLSCGATFEGLVSSELAFNTSAASAASKGAKS